MKKLLLILTMLVMMLPSMCFADPVIKSDSRTFNPLTGVYDLQEIGRASCRERV